MAILSLSQLRENIKKEQENLICNFCEKKIDISVTPFVRTWIDGKIFHKSCYQKYRGLK